MKIKSIRQVKNLAGKRVLLRADFNAPIEGGRIRDDYKIVAGLLTIRFLLRYKSKVIIITHLGRPLKNHKLNAKDKKNYSVKPIAAHLSRLLDRKVKFIDDSIGLKANSSVAKMKNGEVLLLENLRFYKGEETNNKKFAKELASLADIYVNNAFGVSHRAHASLSAVKKYLPSYAGLLPEDEINNLNKILKPKRPLVVIIGGAKTASKIKLIKKLYKKAHRILIGGVLANNFFAAHKLEVGKSVTDRETIKFARSFKRKNNNRRGASIILPIDVLVSKRKDGAGRPVIKNVYSVDKNETILDIGPQTMRLYASFIKEANTIIWNGPMGMFEAEHFKQGTLSMARVVASRSTGFAFGVVGGGETVEALRITKMLDHIDWVSTGGGAMLAYLGGGKMPGLDKIIK